MSIAKLPRCSKCGQVLQKVLLGGKICINSKCPEYFEPALRQPAPFGAAAPAVEGTAVCDVCRREPCDCICGKAAEILDKAFKQEESDMVRVPFEVTFNSVPHPEAPRAHGVKLDQGKPLVYTEFLRQFPRAIRMVARVGERGTQAPGHVRSGWKSVKQGYERYSDAFARHILKEAILATTEEPDSPDPMHDLLWEAATVAWNDLARLEHLIRANQGAAERIDGDPLA